jgi:hypothetical protein
MWYRVFGLDATPVSPAALAGHLHAAGLPVEPHFKGDDLGWTSGQIILPGGGTPVVLERYLTTEDDLRDDLNAYAAELETMDYSPAHQPLMEHVIRSQQLVTLRKPIDHADDARLDDVCEAAVKFLSAGCRGVYQIDGKGWFAADGALLLPEY